MSPLFFFYFLVFIFLSLLELVLIFRGSLCQNQSYKPVFGSLAPCSESASQGLHYSVEIGPYMPGSLKEQFWTVLGSIKEPGSVKVLGSLKVPYKLQCLANSKSKYSYLVTKWFFLLHMTYLCSVDLHTGSPLGYSIFYPYRGMEGNFLNSLLGWNSKRKL